MLIKDQTCQHNTENAHSVDPAIGLWWNSMDYLKGAKTIYSRIDSCNEHYYYGMNFVISIWIHIKTRIMVWTRFLLRETLVIEN